MKKRTLPMIVALAVTSCGDPAAKEQAKAEPSTPQKAEPTAKEAEPSTPEKNEPSTPRKAEPTAKEAEADENAPVIEDDAPGSDSSLHVIARSNARIQLHPLAGDGLFASAGPLTMRVDERGELVHDLQMLRGLQSVRGVFAEDDDFAGIVAWGPVALGGRWPDAVYMSLDLASEFRGEGGSPEVHRWDGQAWTSIKAAGRKYRWYPAEVHPWIEGSLLARRVFQPVYGDGSPEDAEEPSDKEVDAAAAAIAKAKKIVVIRGAPKAPPTPSTVTAFTSRATGEVFVVDGSDPPNLQRLDAAGSTHTVALPGENVEVRGVLADGVDRAWVFGMQSEDQAWLVRVEGEKATKAEAPPCDKVGIASLSVLADGSQWATCSDVVEAVYTFETGGYSLWRRPADGAWSRVELPAGIKAPRRVVARAADDVWVSAEDDKGSVLLHSRSRASVLELPGLPGISRQVVEYNDPLSIEDHCSYPYVPLRSPVADAEKVKAALDEPMGRLETSVPVLMVKTTFRGKPQLGLQLLVPDEAKEALKVAKVVRKALGKDAAETPHCWYAEESEQEGKVFAKWGEYR